LSGQNGSRQPNRRGFRLFTAEELSSQLREAGYVDVSSERLDDSVFTWGRKEASEPEDPDRRN
jgi:hypothetical protein